MQTILISSEVEVLNEIDILNGLFINDLSVFHLRKKNASEEIYRKFLEQINTRFHNRIVLHEHHHLLKDFKLKGIHLKEFKRKEVEKEIGSYKQECGFLEETNTISSSFHSKEEINTCKLDFDYMLLSPIFDSISKKEYLGKRFNVSEMDKNIIALGGIDENNIIEAKKLGYGGVAVLGSIWNAENPLKSFLRLQQVCQQL